jgi:hypothetical protein
VFAIVNLYENTRLYANADSTAQTKSGKLYSSLEKQFFATLIVSLSFAGYALENNSDLELRN